MFVLTKLGIGLRNIGSAHLNIRVPIHHCTLTSRFCYSTGKRGRLSFLNLGKSHCSAIWSRTIGHSPPMKCNFIFTPISFISFNNGEIKHSISKTRDPAKWRSCPACACVRTRICEPHVETACCWSLDSHSWSWGFQLCVIYL